MELQKFASLIISKNIKIEELSKVVSKYNLNYLLPALHKYLLKYERSELEMNTVGVISPFQISAENINKIESKYKIKIEKKEIDKELLGGYILYTRDKIVDNTLKNIIKRLTK